MANPVLLTVGASCTVSLFSTLYSTEGLRSNFGSIIYLGDYHAMWLLAESANNLCSNQCGRTTTCRLTKSKTRPLWLARLASCQAGTPNGRNVMQQPRESRSRMGKKLAGCKMALSRIGLVSLKSSETVTVLTLAPRGWRCRVEMLVNCDRSEVDETPTSRSDLQT